MHKRSVLLTIILCYIYIYIHNFIHIHGYLHIYIYIYIWHLRKPSPTPHTRATRNCIALVRVCCAVLAWLYHFSFMTGGASIPVSRYTTISSSSVLTEKTPATRGGPPLGAHSSLHTPDFARRAPLGDAARSVGRRRLNSSRTYDNIQGMYECVNSNKRGTLGKWITNNAFMSRNSHITLNSAGTKVRLERSISKTFSLG